MTSTGDVPVHDVVLTDDLSGVLANATVVGGSILGAQPRHRRRSGEHFFGSINRWYSAQFVLA